MSRTLKKSMWKEGHRRSPRISALDAQRTTQVPTTAATTTTTTTTNNNTTTAKQKPNSQGPASRTRSRKKRKLRPLQDVAATSILPNLQQADKQQIHEDHPITSDQQLVQHSQQNNCIDISSTDLIQGDDGPKNEDQASYPGMLVSDQPSSAPSTSWMPEKRILQLILDILQRRDTYEIFAEPVDPEEVEDYYEIIKEPMDFGTMRAKLHEEMYKSLEQFEHDVFLISGNAMHFNSSATIFFRQARAIHELATKVFHALKTDPENFELEFSETRRRTGRRPHTEARGPFYSSSPKLAANSRSSGMTSNISSKSMPSSLNGSSNLKRSIRRNPGCSGTASHFSARDHEVPPGAVDGRRASFLEVDRRCMYRPWTSFLNEDDSTVSTIDNNSKSLMHVNQQDISYGESLMLFVKDLGPIAQMIAKRKLNGWSADTPYFWTSGSNYWFQAPECKNPTATTSAQQELSALNSANTTLMSQNLLDHLHGHLTVLGSTSDKIDLCDANKGGRNYTGSSCSTLVEVASNGDKKKIPGAFRGEVHSSDTTNVVGVNGSDKVEQNESTGIQFSSFSSFAGARDLKFSVPGLKETGNKPTTMIFNKSNLDQAQLLESALEHSQSNLLEFKLKNNYISSSSSWPLQTIGSSSFNQTKGFVHNLSSQCLRSNDQAIAAQGPSHGISSSSEAGQGSKSSQQPSLASQFTFDLPYLKTRLNQINSLGQDRLSKQGSHMENSFSDKMSYQRAFTCTHQAELSTQPYNDDHQQSSLDIQRTDLALQL